MVTLTSGLQRRVVSVAGLINMDINEGEGFRKSGFQRRVGFHQHSLSLCLFFSFFVINT